LPECHLLGHPSEPQIVAATNAQHLLRLGQELTAALPAYIFTLGRAALRVMPGLVNPVDNAVIPTEIPLDQHYGDPILVTVGGIGHPSLLVPLCHTNAPSEYQDIHDWWMQHRAPTDYL
jgi:hypothetical protein